MESDKILKDQNPEQTQLHSNNSLDKKDEHPPIIKDHEKKPDKEEKAEKPVNNIDTRDHTNTANPESHQGPKHNPDNHNNTKSEEPGVDAEIEAEFKEDEEEVSESGEQDDKSANDENTNSKNADPQNGDGQGDQKKKIKHVKKKRRRSFCLDGFINAKMDQYNGLKDDLLQGFFCNDQRKKHLIKMGLVTKDGYVVNKPEEYLRKKALYNKIYGLENKEAKGKRSKTFNKKVKNPYQDEFDTKADKPLKESKKPNIAVNKRG